jgi:SAM-dependent methyltransferase
MTCLERSEVGSLRDNWEQRAVESGSQLSGVLFRGLSTPANSVVDDWHTWLVRQVFLPNLAKQGHVLDLGCGYGRLSNVVAAQRSDLVLTGQDIAMGYCRRFEQAIGRCVQADATQLPFIGESFDGILAVTCLMYVAPERIPELLNRLRLLLRPGGVLLLLDPGLEVQRLVARVRGIQASSPTGGQGFTCAEYCKLTEDAGFVIRARGGNPWMSMALMTPGVAKAMGSPVSTMLARTGRIDHQEAGYRALALHRWLLVQRPIRSILS